MRFWISVLTALDRVRPGMVTDLLTYVHTRQLPPLQSILSELINRLTEQSAQFLLVLDDYHLLTEQAIHTSFAYLLDHLPPQLCLLLATRMEPALPLSRLRARGQMLEVRAEQLRCTLEEAKTFFRDVMDIELEDAAIHQVTRRTEGWWIGLQLMGLSLQGHTPPGASISLLEEAEAISRHGAGCLFSGVRDKPTSTTPTT